MADLSDAQYRKFFVFTDMVNNFGSKDLKSGGVMLKDRYDDFLTLAGEKLSGVGYRKDRKKGLFLSESEGKVRRIEFRMRKKGDIGNIDVLVSVEYPLLNGLISQITSENLKGTRMFDTYAENLPGIRMPNGFTFCEDTDMEYLTEMLADLINDRVVPFFSRFDSDISMIRMFERNQIWYKGDAENGKKSQDYYFRWAGLCFLNHFYQEGLEILKYASLERNVPEIKQYWPEIEKMVENGKQRDSWYLKTTTDQICVSPSDEEIEEYLYGLDGRLHSFIVMINPATQNYIQAAGASGEFIVEVREYHGEDYIHYRYCRRQGEGGVRKLPCQFGFMKVSENEVVSRREAVRILLEYLRHGSMYHKEDWKDITDRL